MTENHIETLRKRMDEALLHPSPSGTLLPIGELMDWVVGYFSSPNQRREAKRSQDPAYHRAAAG